MKKGDQLCILRAEVKTDADALNLLRLVAALTALGIPLDDDCPYLETRELVENRERRTVTWTLKARSICGQHDARKLIEAWHDPVWTTQNAEHPFAYIVTAFRNAGLLAAEVSRLIAQSPDPEHYYSSADMRRAMAISGLPAGHTPFNAGLLGGCDLALVRAYAFAALELARKFAHCDLNGTTTSMMIEQYHLGVFAARTGVPVTTLLPARPPRSQVTLAGYAHLTGSAKRNPIYVARAEARLRRDFPEAHERFLAGWQQLLTDGHHRHISEAALY